MRALFGRKVCTLAELKEVTDHAIKRGQPGHPYTVTREVHLSNEDFTTFSSNLLRDQPWITKDDGGVNQEGKIRCIRVINQDTGDIILVNNEGFDYARYTSLETP